jgi:hypothetical protein
MEKVRLDGNVLCENGDLRRNDWVLGYLGDIWKVEACESGILRGLLGLRDGLRTVETGGLYGGISGGGLCRGVWREMPQVGISERIKSGVSVEWM